MKHLKRAYYSIMFNVTDFAMWLTANDPPLFHSWWTISEAYKRKLEAL